MYRSSCCVVANRAWWGVAVGRCGQSAWAMKAQCELVLCSSSNLGCHFSTQSDVLFPTLLFQLTIVPSVGLVHSHTIQCPKRLPLQSQYDRITAIPAPIPAFSMYGIVSGSRDTLGGSNIALWEQRRARERAGNCQGFVPFPTQTSQIGALVGRDGTRSKS